MTTRGVRVRSLSKSFRSFRRRHQVLREIDLDIAPGEVVGLIGPNGAGKTTLMSSLLGFLHPDEGEVTVDGLRNDDLDVRRRTGFVPERMNFDRGATGIAFLRYMARLAGVPAEDVEEKAHAMLQRLGIDEAADRRLSQYSRGMLQRIGMCQALIHQPEYIFLDEPASGLDPNGVLVVRDLIAEQKTRGAAVLLNSHQLSEVEKICDRVLFLTGGVIARTETLRHSDHMVVAVKLLDGRTLIETVESEAEIAALVRRLVEGGAEIVDVRPHVTDLERIFRGES